MPQQQDEQQKQESSQQYQFTPGQYDQSFEQIAARAASSSSPDATWAALSGVFDLAEQTVRSTLAEQSLRSARRVGEVQVFQLMRQQIVHEVTSQMTSSIRQNPQLLQQVVQEIISAIKQDPQLRQQLQSASSS